MFWEANRIGFSMPNLRWYRRGFGTAPEGAVAWIEARAVTDMDFLQRELTGRPWLAGPAPSVADISASAYVFLTKEAELDPARWPAVLAWLDRMRALPGWVEQYRLMAR
jgi:glutathione S-transferase